METPEGKARLGAAPAGRQKILPRLATITAAALLVVMGGCGSKTRADVEGARAFRAFPLYWAGERFERWDLKAIEGLRDSRSFVSFVYGACTPRDGEQPSCAPPFEIQISPLCSHLDVVARSPVWNRQQIRGAPVGRNPDGAPVLFSRAAQVKVYRGQDSDPELPQRVLRALRSVNDISPVIDADDPIPGSAPGVLEGTRPCTS